jgi:hypothetical protein
MSSKADGFTVCQSLCRPIGNLIFRNRRIFRDSCPKVSDAIASSVLPTIAKA